MLPDLQPKELFVTSSILQRTCLNKSGLSLHYYSACHGGWVTPSPLEIHGDANSRSVRRKAKFQITGTSIVWWKCCLHLYGKWFGINDIGLNEEQLFCSWTSIWTTHLDRLVMLHQVLCFTTRMPLENTVGTFLPVQVSKIFLSLNISGHEFPLMLQCHVSMEQRENA